jgi:hypothetical protein
MPLTKFTGNTNNIQSLADKPTETPRELKVLFDKVGEDIKTYINEILTTEIDNLLANKAPTNHASSNSQYGISDSTHYGHCKIINSLHQKNYTPGEALSANQGYEINRRISNLERKNIITVGLSTGYTIENAGNNDLTLDNIIAQVGDRLSLSDGKIVIGEGIHHVLVSGEGMMGAISSGAKNFVITHNNNECLLSMNTYQNVSSNVNLSRGLSAKLVPVGTRRYYWIQSIWRYRR